MAIKELYTNLFTNHLVWRTDKRYNGYEKKQLKVFVLFLLCCEIKYLTRDPYTLTFI